MTVITDSRLRHRDPRAIERMKPQYDAWYWTTVGAPDDPKPAYARHRISSFPFRRVPSGDQVCWLFPDLQCMREFLQEFPHEPKTVVLALKKMVRFYRNDLPTNPTRGQVNLARRKVLEFLSHFPEEMTLGELEALLDDSG